MSLALVFFPFIFTHVADGLPTCQRHIIEMDTKQSHRLLHMLPRGVVGGASEMLPTSLEFYAPAQLELASSEVARRVCAKAEQTATLRLHKLLAEPPSSPAHAALY